MMSSTPVLPKKKGGLAPRSLGREFVMMEPLATTPEKNPPPPPPPMRPKTAKSFSRVLVGEVLDVCQLGTPVKLWPRGFWTARKHLSREVEKFWRPSLEVPASPQDIFK